MISAIVICGSALAKRACHTAFALHHNSSRWGRCSRWDVVAGTWVNIVGGAAIEGYAMQLNELVSAKLTCKGVNQVVPMKLQTEKFGVDYWAMPSFNFADEKGYVPFTQLLDKESVE